MTGNECDNCRKFGINPTMGWLVLAAIAENISIFGASSSGYETLGTFCSKQCVIEYLYVSLATEKEGA